MHHVPYKLINEIFKCPVQDARGAMGRVPLLVTTFSYSSDPYGFRYEEALVEVIKAKIDGHEPEVAQEHETAKAIDFMEALRASVQAEDIPKKPPAASRVSKKKAVKKKKAG